MLATSAHQRLQTMLAVCAPRLRRVLPIRTGQCRASGLSSTTNTLPAVPPPGGVLSTLDNLQAAQMALRPGAELHSDLPGFTDREYRMRRDEVITHATSYRSSDSIPCVHYLPQEHKVWSLCWDKLRSVYPSHACQLYQDGLEALTQAGVFTRKEVPQLQDVSAFVKEASNMSLRPAPGMMAPRAFFKGLAQREFFCTQYIRHPSNPFYAPEPDIVHDMMGHVPLLINREYADFSHAIGLASLGASDRTIEQLAGIYMSFVEFGLVRDGDRGVRIIGAGLLSSSDEMQSVFKAGTNIVAFDAHTAANTDYELTSAQNQYFVADSLTEVAETTRQFIEEELQLHN